MKLLQNPLFLCAFNAAIFASLASATITDRLDALLDTINDTTATAADKVEETLENISGEYTLDINLPEGEFAVSHTQKPASTIWNRLSHKLKRLGCLMALRLQYAKEWVKEQLA